MTDYPLTYLIAKVFSTAVMGALIAWVCVLENIKKSLFCWRWSRYTTVLYVSHLPSEECTSLRRREKYVRYRRCYVRTILPSYSEFVGDGSLIWLLPSLLEQASSVRPSALNASGLQREIKHVAYSRSRPSIWAWKLNTSKSGVFLWQQLPRVGQAGRQQRKLLKEEHCCNKAEWNPGKTPKSSSHLMHRHTNVTTLGYLCINPTLHTEEVRHAQALERFTLLLQILLQEWAQRCQLSSLPPDRIWHV